MFGSGEITPAYKSCSPENDIGSRRHVAHLRHLPVTAWRGPNAAAVEGNCNSPQTGDPPSCSEAIIGRVRSANRSADLV